MNIHEYQAKEVLRGFGAPVPRGKPAFTVAEAVAAAKELGGPVWVVKAQIHAGGRGKGGGVKVVKSIEDVEKEAKRMLGMTLVTHQTGPHGRLVKRLYIEDGSAIERELYISALVDRATSRIAFIASLWRTPKRCSSSITSRPRRANFTSADSSLWVPITMSIEPSARPSIAALISLAERKRLISATLTGHLPKRSAMF